jgi:two-component system sensor histidine kinase BaeS
MNAKSEMPRPWWSSLGVRLFVSYVVVVAIGIATLLVAASFAAPSFFDLRMARMMDNPVGEAGFGMMMGRGGLGAGNAQPVAQFDAALADTFRASLAQGLLVACAAAVATAIGASLLVSRHIATPIHQLAQASHRIADGQYSERVAAQGRDELGELGASFNAMAAALEQTEHRRMQLIGDVAHELRTPIATLSGYLEGLMDGVVQPSDQTWGRLHGETGRLQRLVDDLQELSRAEAHQLSLHPQRLAVADTVRVAADRLRDAFLEKGVTLDVDMPDGLPLVMADPDRLVQVLTNLLTNALRYTPAPRHVGIQATYAGGSEVAVAVCDTGVGIAAEHLPHVFERFYRVDKSRSRALGGSGIGLTIARAAVEAMGGRMWAESDGPGRGATFSFTLPVADE